MRPIQLLILLAAIPAYAGLGISTSNWPTADGNSSECGTIVASSSTTQLRKIATDSSRIIAQLTDDDGSDHSIAAERRFVELINAERSAQGAPALAEEPDLDAVALAHCRYLADEFPASWRKISPITHQEVSSHYGKAGEDPCYRVVQGADKSLGFLYGAGENNAAVTGGSDLKDPEGTAKGFVQQFLASPEHRQNLLAMRYNQTGVAICRSETTHTSIAVQVFAIRMTFKTPTEKKNYERSHSQLYADPYQKSCGI